MSDAVVTISVTEFKAKCLSLFDDLERHKVAKVIVTRRGRPVGELTPPQRRHSPLHGAGRGSVTISPGVDLTAPTFDEDEFDSLTGRLHR
jgi:antitoxin (DNA-binding transcriptional repressor) of toxin-antitoxin stability system